MTEIRTIHTILVANRGEIAVRIMRTCKDQGIATVAVFSEIDRTAPHVLMADKAVCLGAAPAKESYLNIDKIVNACKQTNADAVHPGYGFLSENSEFAMRIIKEGLIFIGPSSHVMEQMGNKIAARTLMIETGISVVPGSNGIGSHGFASGEDALITAKDIGFPVLLKASAGGGGKGMRFCESEDKFVSAFDGARREAITAFGNDAIYVEKAILRPRHIEIQILADMHGNIVHLAERDCSIQRRHQKVIEETPSPVLDDTLRTQMGEVAVSIAKAVNYVGAGTIEFLLSEDGSFYFLEMNTRLQVEHPITEMIFNLDLVALQIDIACGKTLPFDQSSLDLRRHGVAMECRVYAEDPYRFLPSPGTITALRVPEGAFVRHDSGIHAGLTISPYYDPMLAKLIVWGENREEVLGRMSRALQEYAVLGIKTNLLFHRRMMAHPLFINGEYDTGFIEREKKTLLHTGDAPADVVLFSAAIEQSLEKDTMPIKSVQQHTNHWRNMSKTSLD